MTRMIRSQVVLAAVVLVASSMSFAEAPGEATYTAKCKMCHGATGAADTPTAKMLKVKPVSDPEIKKLTAEQMFEATKNGKGKMKPVTGLTDAQIKEAVAYYRTLK